MLMTLKTIFYVLFNFIPFLSFFKRKDSDSSSVNEKTPMTLTTKLVITAGVIATLLIAFAGYKALTDKDEVVSLTKYNTELTSQVNALENNMDKLDNTSKISNEIIEIKKDTTQSAITEVKNKSKRDISIELSASKAKPAITKIDKDSANVLIELSNSVDKDIDNLPDL